MKFILTIDTEADNQWDHGRELTVENLKFIPRFQELCNKYAIIPTYLVTSEVCEDAFAKEIFPEYILKGKAEVGTHLHSWTTPPFLDKAGYTFNDKNHIFASEIESDLVEKKIITLTNQIEKSFGRRPTSFRSGRYGFSENVGKILAENNYLVDSSVTPYTSWTYNKGLPNGSGGPDFIDKTPFPYRYQFEKASLLEIPITILPTKFPFNQYQALSAIYFRNVNQNFFLKVIRKLLFAGQPLWLRPYMKTKSADFISILNEAKRINLPFLVMMFHSSELMPGCSIYRKDEQAIERLYTQLEEFFIFLNERKIVSESLSEAAINYTV